MKLVSLRNLVYHSIKPLLPRAAQIALRRRVANLRMRAASRVWPIDPSCGARPDGWPGWPGGRRFAFVLTHDVENLRGVSRSVRLADMERGLGFVSSFNFVPERYETPPSVREELCARGVEVGVHDLLHDGKLYKSERVFRERAVRINGYLRRLGISGVPFRSDVSQSRVAPVA